MLFNSLDFAVYLPIVFLLYWFVTKNNLKQQNTLLLIASYIFYGWWDWRFLTLIVFSSLVDYQIGIKIANSSLKKQRKLLLITSILVNMGFLGFFKYFNFFIDNFTQAFTLLGYQMEASRLDIILPVGISFYSFQTLSYTIDVYRGKLEPTKDIVAFFAFVSFFPQLVAGPIERASNLLPQFFEKRTFDYANAADGMRQILWGMFKKVVVADNCAIYANEFFGNYGEYSGGTLFLGAVFFAFQIYGDFSGYSDIAIGTARLFGFNLMQNFSYPYFSRNIAEFWRRWHISLSSWFRDYIYIPLGGSKGGVRFKIRNILIIFLISGFWHGANWTFVAWGAFNAILFIPLMLVNRNRTYLDTVSEGRLFVKFSELFQVIITFVLTTFAWIFFRAESISHAYDYINHLLSNIFVHPGQPTLFLWTGTFMSICILVMVEWLQRTKQHGLQIANLHFTLRHSCYIVVVFLIMSLGKFGSNEFIYFQF